MPRNVTAGSYDQSMLRFIRIDWASKVAVPFFISTSSDIVLCPFQRLVFSGLWVSDVLIRVYWYLIVFICNFQIMVVWGFGIWLYCGLEMCSETAQGRCSKASSLFKDYSLKLFGFLCLQLSYVFCLTFIVTAGRVRCIIMTRARIPEIINWYFIECRTSVGFCRYKDEWNRAPPSKCISYGSNSQTTPKKHWS